MSGLGLSAWIDGVTGETTLGRILEPEKTIGGYGAQILPVGGDDVVIFPRQPTGPFAVRIKNVFADAKCDPSAS